MANNLPWPELASEGYFYPDIYAFQTEEKFLMVFRKIEPDFIFKRYNVYFLQFLSILQIRSKTVEKTLLLL